MITVVAHASEMRPRASVPIHIVHAAGGEVRFDAHTTIETSLEVEILRAGWHAAVHAADLSTRAMRTNQSSLPRPGSSLIVHECLRPSNVETKDARLV